MKSYKLLIFAIIFSALCLSKRLGSKSRVAKLEDAEKTPQVCKCIKSEGSEMYELLGVTGYLLYKTKEKCDEDVKLICAWVYGEFTASDYNLRTSFKAGDEMKAGEGLMSENKQYYFVVHKSTGELVLYNSTDFTKENTLFETRLDAGMFDTLRLTPGGNLNYGSSMRGIWFSDTEAGIGNPTLNLNNDGLLFLSGCIIEGLENNPECPMLPYWILNFGTVAFWPRAMKNTYDDIMNKGLKLKIH